MALTGTDRGTGTHNSSSNTLSVVPGSNLTAGAWAVLVVAMDNPTSGTDISGVTDTKNNVWTIRQLPLVDPGAAAAGQQGCIATTSQNSGVLTTSDTITVAHGTQTAKSWTLMEVTAASANAIGYVTGNIGTSGTGTTSPTITTGTIPVGDMVIGCVCIEAGTTQTVTGDADTTNGSWSARQIAQIGTTTSGSCVTSQRKVQTTTGSAQTYNPTLGILGDLALGWIQLTEVLPANLPDIVTEPLASWGF